MNTIDKLFLEIEKNEREQEVLENKAELLLIDLIETFREESGLSVGDTIYLNQYEKEVIISKFYIGRSQHFGMVIRNPGYYSKEEIIKYSMRKQTLCAECYEVTKSGKKNKTVLPEGNKYCLEDIKIEGEY